jgi:hypothetical protein
MTTKSAVQKILKDLLHTEEQIKVSQKIAGKNKPL